MDFDLFQGARLKRLQGGCLCQRQREFPLEDVLRIWENLLTNVCGRHFHLFIALAILQAHRDVIMRYLNSFDEVLKYVNELSSTCRIATASY